MQLWCDNYLHIDTNPMLHEQIKHVEVNCHFVMQKLQEGVIDLRHIKIGEQLDDLFANTLLGKQVDSICNKLGMFDIYALG